MRREVSEEGNRIKKQNAKLRNNAMSGKSIEIENTINKVGVKIVYFRKQYTKCSFSPIFKREKQFRNGAIAIEKEKCGTNFDRSVDFRTIMLSLNKVLMQDFHYVYIKNKYGNKAGMLPTDN